MILGDLIKRSKIKIPNIKSTGLSDDDLTVLLNEGVEQVNLICKAYRGYTDFDIVNGQQTYSLATVAPTFQQIVTAGLWCTTSGLPADLKRVIPRTEEWLNKRLPTWRQASPSTIAQYYYQSGDNLVLYPAMNANIPKGGRIYHLIRPQAMAGNAYPFTGNGTEIIPFRAFDNAIIEYVRWQIAPSYNAQTGEDMSYPRFLQFCDIAKRQVKAKPDASGYYDVAVSQTT